MPDHNYKKAPEGIPIENGIFLTNKQLILNDLGEIQEVGPGFVTGWSALDKESRKYDVEEVLTGKRSFGVYDPIIKELYTEHKDYQKVADELAKKIEKGELPQFWMTVSDTPYEKQLQLFQRMISIEDALKAVEKENTIK
jgi:hypothetical protein